MKLEDCFYLGYVFRASGDSGRIGIKLDTDRPEAYKKLESVLVRMNESDQSPVPFFIQRIHKLEKDEVTLDLDLGRQLPNASFLKGKSVYLPLDLLPDLGKNKFYFHEVIGFEVIDAEKGSIGKVKDFYDSAAHSVMAVEQGEREILIPLTDEVLKEVDKKGKRIEVETPPGLIELYLD